ncbi:MAG: hypothetical protein MRY49_01835 [Candidatus Pacebacteria bacterium]|nr:hypothetical protein [Candidatus Paceibacterota bacterium]
MFTITISGDLSSGVIDVTDAVIDSTLQEDINENSFDFSDNHFEIGPDMIVEGPENSHLIPGGEARISGDMIISNGNEVLTIDPLG